MTVDWVTPLNGILLTFGSLITVLLTFYANQWMALQKKKHAAEIVEAAIVEGAAAEKNVDKAVNYVKAVAPAEIKTLGLDPTQLELKVAARVSASRNMVL